MVGSVSDTIPNYKECSQEALESQLDATSKAYEIIMTKDNISAKDDETERCKIQADDARGRGTSKINMPSSRRARGAWRRWRPALTKNTTTNS
jgi:hypothetical protein